MSTIVVQAFITLDGVVDGFALSRLILAETRALQSGVLINTYRRSDAGRA